MLQIKLTRGCWVQALPKTWTNCGVDISLDNLSIGSKYHKSLMTPSVSSPHHQQHLHQLQPGTAGRFSDLFARL